MCGRFAVALSPKKLAEFFDALAVDEAEPRFNIAPTQPVLAIRNLADDPTRRMELLQWGLVPFWAQDPRIAGKLFNARAETLAEKPSFKSAFKRRRCVIVASGFFEWQAKGAHLGKTPYYIHYADRRPMAFAGLWDSWTDRKTGEMIESCTIITSAANTFMQALHMRMPVLVQKPELVAWLDPGNSQRDDLNRMLRPYAGEDLAAFPVSRDVNKTVNDHAGLIDPVDIEDRLLI